MILDTKLLLEHGADGIAFGFLKEDQTLDTERTKEVIYLIHEQGREAVFHRAFDCVADQKKTIEAIDWGLGRPNLNERRRTGCVEWKRTVKTASEGIWK